MELCLSVKLDDGSRLFAYYSSFFLFVMFCFSSFFGGVFSIVGTFAFSQA